MATPSKTFHLNLTPAALVHREKLLLRQTSELPKDIIPLPNFNFVAPFPASQAGNDRVMVKAMLQAISVALLEIQERHKEDMSFVSLVKFGFVTENFDFHFYCPQADIVKRVSDFKINRPSSDRLGSLEIGYKFTLSTDILMPLVFSFDQKARKLLITNENHINYPDQFLDPARCKSTSGFLNFIGTLSMLKAADALDSHIEAVVNQANLAINLDVDEWLRWLYCFIDTRVLYETKRIIVRRERPEDFFFTYSSDDTLAPKK